LPSQPPKNTTSSMKNLTKLLCISTALLLRPNAQAWSGAGHQVIAAEAYRQLPPNLQKKVTEILEAHPDCARNGRIRLPLKAPTSISPLLSSYAQALGQMKFADGRAHTTTPNGTTVIIRSSKRNSRLSLVLIQPTTFFTESANIQVRVFAIFSRLIETPGIRH
jgi:hypothetical protein